MINTEKEVKEKVQSAMKKHGITLHAVILIGIMILSSVISIVISSFTGEANLNILTSVTYWARQISTAFTTFLVFVLARQTNKIIEGNKNEDYIALKKQLINRYNAINKANLFDEFHNYIYKENVARKLKAYTEKLKQKKKKHQVKLNNLPDKGLFLNWRKARRHKKISHFDALLATAKDDVLFVNMRYNKVSYSKIFSGEGGQNDNDDDFSTHEGSAIATKGAFKLLWVFAIGLIFGLVGTSLVANESVWVTILNITIMLMQLLMSIFFGWADGAEFLISTVNNKLRLRIAFVSKFCVSNSIEVEDEHAANKSLTT